MKRLLALGIGLCAALAVVAPAEAAAPDYIMVTGPGLAQPVLLDSLQENFELMLATANRGAGVPQRTAKGLSKRTRYRLWLFWGWGRATPPTDPTEASQRGSFYPARRRQRAVIVLRVDGITIPRFAPPQVLAILGRHGIPLRVP
jgi:hypothetical protein